MKWYVILLIFSNTLLYSQNRVNVIDQDSLPVPNAIILLNGSDVVETNEIGYCSLQLDSVNIIKVYRLGYSVLDTTIHRNNNPIYITLKRGNKLKQVTIETNLSDIENDLNRAAQIDRSFIEKVPSISGSYDITKALKILPSVSESFDFSTGLIVRGGLQNQNQFLLDHVPIYNLSHFGGILSVVNGEMVKSIDFYNGPIPAKFGGRLSSIVSINSIEASTTKSKIKYNLGMLDAGFTISVPIIKNKMSFISTTRFLHVAPFTLISGLLYRQGRTSDKFKVGFYDSYNKIQYYINNKSSLSFSYFTTKDLQENGSGEFGGNEEIASFNWTNNIFSVIYKSAISKKLYFKQILASSNYSKSNLNFSTFNGTSNETLFGNKISGLSIHSKFDWYINNNYTHTFGGILSKRTLKFNHSFPEMELNNKSQNHEINIYSDHNFKVNRFSFRPGIRTTIVSHIDANDISFNPRLNILYQINDKNEMALGATKLSQSVFNVSSALIGFTNELWFQVDNNFKLQKSWIFNISYKFEEERFSNNLSVYFKQQKELIDDQILLDIDRPLQLNELTELIKKNGVSLSYGFEYWARMKTEKVDFMLSYTLSKTKLKYPQVFDGEYYDSTFDRPHQINCVAQTNLNEKWSFFANFIFQSGLKYSYPSIILNNSDNTTVPFYTGRNQFTLPYYHRVDFGLKKKWLKKDRVKTININILNAYNRKNISFLLFTNSDPVKLEKVTLIPLMLSLSYYSSF